MAFVHPEAKLGDGNIIGPFCYIDKNTVIGDNNVMQNSVTINYGARIGNGNEFFPGASISTKPQDLKFRGEDTICEVGDNNSIRENVTISRGTASKGTSRLGNNNLVMENAHIAHDCFFGNNIIIGNSTKFAGEVTCDDYAVISGGVLCHQFTNIGSYVMVQGGTRFGNDIPPYVMAGRDPVSYCGLNLVGLRRHGFSNEKIDLIHNVYRMIYGEGLLKDNVQAVKDKFPDSEDVAYICAFIEKSTRGIIHPGHK